MNWKKLAVASFGLCLALAPAAQSQDLPAEDSKGGKVITNANSGPDQGGMQRSGAETSAPAPGAAGNSGAKAGGAPSPDEILEKMNTDQGGADDQVNTERSPAQLEKGQFESGRDIFENIFDQPKNAGPLEDGLPGMRIEEANLQGVMTGAFGTVALFEGKDKEMYIARENQKFYNGRLAQIHKDKVVFEQEVIDEFGKKRPPIVKEIPLHTEARPKVKKGRGQ